MVGWRDAVFSRLICSADEAVAMVTVLAAVIQVGRARRTDAVVDGLD